MHETLYRLHEKENVGSGRRCDHLALLPWPPFFVGRGHPLSLANFAPYNTTARLAGSRGDIQSMRESCYQLCPKGLSFSDFRYLKVGVLLVEVFEKVGKSVIAVFEKT